MLDPKTMSTADIHQELNSIDYALTWADLDQETTKALEARDRSLFEALEYRTCANCGEEIHGEPFRYGLHSFHHLGCFQEWDDAVMDKLRGKYQ